MRHVRFTHTLLSDTHTNTHLLIRAWRKLEHTENRNKSLKIKHFMAWMPVVHHRRWLTSIPPTVTKKPLEKWFPSLTSICLPTYRGNIYCLIPVLILSCTRLADRQNNHIIQAITFYKKNLNVQPLAWVMLDRERSILQAPWRHLSQRSSRELGLVSTSMHHEEVTYCS